MIADYEAEIKEKLEDGDSIKSIYMSLLNRTSFDSLKSYSNFKQYVNRWYFDSKVEGKHLVPKYRYETPPGEQLQFDWVESIKMVNRYGEIFEFNIFSATLGASRLHVFLYSRNKTRIDVQRCLVKTFEYIGGVPEELLTDNMSSIVDTKTKKFRKEFITFTNDMGTKAKKCKVRHPYTKGKDESANRFMSWLIPYNNEFEDEKELIDLIYMINSKVNSSVNQTTRVTPNFLFQKEKEYLLPIPKENILEQYTKKTKKYLVYPDSLINFNNKKYSVPSKYIGQYVYAQQIDSYLYIYFNTFLISKHKIDEKIFNYEKEHYKELLSLTVKDEEKLEKYTKQNLEIYDTFLQEVEK